MNTQNVWIKRSEREPVQEDAPVVYGKYDGPRWIESSAQNVWHMGLNTDYTHWRSIKADPPPKELTQRERDMEMVHQLLKANDYPPHTWTALQAIYAERREVAKLLTEYFGGDCWRDENKVPDMRDIAARLDEQGAK